ncbi:hypothetical protein C8034_v001467 [Colletotrichum sidae]|uniref:Uncharacterized protein n=1 Tax=Colletotrichum sidae TaxID=1347389 RepID=A0A4R8SUS8_9PEZI|nr:hypothetical protein C8034_v001467 [Colletotrichum sidae]
MRAINYRPIFSSSYNNITTNNNNNNNNKNTIIILNPYNLNININLIKTINNYKDYSYFYKSLNKLILYKSNFIILSNLLKKTIVKFNFKILLIDKVISIAKKYKIERIKKNLILKSRVFSNNSKYFK